jgi:asparagine synthase (glutamine-hydrolysing)
VLLDGQGADEAIGGYSYFAGAYLLDLARTGHPLRWLRAARLLRDRRGIRVWRELSRAAYHELPLTLRSPVRRAARVGLQLVAPRHRSIAGKPSDPVLRTFTDHCVHAVRHNLPELLRYEDRSSMAFSIESRVPFLDHPLVEFVLSLPPHLKIHDGWTKFVQRKASEGLVPSEIVWRRDKLGFATPQQAWKRTLVGPLRDFVNQADVPMFLDRTRLESLVSSDLSNSAALSEFWQTVFLLKWMQVFRVKFAE